MFVSFINLVTKTTDRFQIENDKDKKSKEKKNGLPKVKEKTKIFKRAESIDRVSMNSVDSEKVPKKSLYFHIF